MRWREASLEQVHASQHERNALDRRSASLLLVAVPFVLAFFITRAVVLGLLLGAGRVPGFRLLAVACRRWPPLMVAGGQAGAILTARGMAGADPGTAVALVLGWILACRVLYQAAGKLTPIPPTLEALDRTIEARWPERWFAGVLRTRRDAFFIRFAINATLVMLPPWAALFAPHGFGLLTCLQLAIALDALGFAYETLDHTDLHNHLFRYRKGTRRWGRLVVRATATAIRLVLDPLCIRVPEYYRSLHIYMHHVENNGAGDLYSTLPYDRLSFVDFCIAAWQKSVGMLLGWDLYRYLLARGRVRQARRMMAGMMYWISLLGILGLQEWRAVVFILLLRMRTGVSGAVNNITWHGLVDMEAPHDIVTNSVNFYPVSAHGDLGRTLHIDHHLNPGEHWSLLAATAADRHRAHLDKGALMFWGGAWSGYAMVQALWARRFDLIANYVMQIGFPPVEIERRILERTRPLVPRVRSPALQRIDAALGQFVARIISPDIPSRERANRMSKSLVATIATGATINADDDNLTRGGVP